MRLSRSGLQHETPRPFPDPPRYRRRNPALARGLRGVLVVIGWTMCSGIGAPEVAAPWVDWRLASEIEKFPRTVLQERFGYRLPDDHNQGDPLLWGDMTEVTPELARSRGVPLPDVLVAGTPCQAFSVAGLRGGTDDARGNLTLKFVETCHAIVDARPDGQLAVLWENVPGVLSDKGNAFGCFLGGLVGAVDALPPPRDGSWPGEGMVQGPRARAAWCVLDAQWFGVAQRRRRVFVVVDFGGACDPAAVLLEPDRLRGDSSPRREPGQVAPTIPARSLGGGGLGTDFDCDGELIASTGDVAHCLNAGGMGRQDYEMETMVAHSLRGEGFDASEDGTGRGTPIVPVAYGLTTEQTPKFNDDCALTLTKQSPTGGGQPQAVAYRVTENDGAYATGDTASALTTGTDQTSQVIAFGSKDHGADAAHDVCPTLRAGGHDGSPANAGVPPAIAIQERAVSTNPNAGPQGKGWQKETAFTLEARNKVQAVAFAENQRGETRLMDAVPALGQGGGKPGQGYPAVATPWAVRRLTPTECHRLQGFPDDHLAITYRGKPAADGNQYKALGNSMAVPVIQWIMDRIRQSHTAQTNGQSGPSHRAASDKQSSLTIGGQGHDL